MPSGLKRFFIGQKGSETLRPKRELSMHDFLVAAAFLLMVILPCIVTMGSASSEDSEEA